MGWKVESKSENVGSRIAQALTVGIAPISYDYEIRNEETDETREVTAYSDDDLGRRISEGNI